MMMTIIPDKYYQLGLYDDNVRQWLPVMNRALEIFFSTGSMPYYDFYNFKGMEIFDVGYYGLYNPLIWVSFLLHNLFGVETTVIYIYISLAIGNIFLFLVSKRITKSNICAFFINVMYTFNPVLYGHSYWYYIFENYWIVPAFSWCFLLALKKNAKMIEKTSPSIVLICSTLGGNIQYTAYYYLLYCIVSFVIYIRYKESIRYFFFNCFIAVLATIPFLHKLLRAANRSSFSGDVNLDFYSIPVNTLAYLLVSVIPSSFVDFVHDFAQLTFVDCNRLFHANIILAFIAFVSIVVKNVINKPFYLKRCNKIILLGIAFGLTWLFYALYLGGKGFLIADVFYHIPFYNNFRFLYKIAFVMPGLLIIPICIALKFFCKSKFRNIYIIVFTLLGIFQICIFRESMYNQNVEIKSIIYSYEYNDNFSHITNRYSAIEKNNYRYLLVIPTNDHKFTLTNNTLPFSNMNVELGMWSVGGYDVAFGYVSDSMKNIYGGDVAFSLNYNNAVSIYTLKNVMKKTSNIRRFIEALKKESVRFILVKDADFSNVEKSLLQNGVPIRLTGYDKNNGISFYEVEDIPMISRNELGESMPISMIDLNEIYIDTENNKYIQMSIRDNPNLKAELINGDMVEQLKIESKDNNVRIDTRSSSGTVHVFYSNKINDLCLVLTCLYSIIILAICSWSIFYSIKHKTYG